MPGVAAIPNKALQNWRPYVTRVPSTRPASATASGSRTMEPGSLPVGVSARPASASHWGASSSPQPSPRPSSAVATRRTGAQKEPRGGRPEPQRKPWQQKLERTYQPPSTVCWPEARFWEQRQPKSPRAPALMRSPRENVRLSSSLREPAHGAIAASPQEAQIGVSVLRVVADDLQGEIAATGRPRPSPRPKPTIRVHPRPRNGIGMGAASSPRETSPKRKPYLTGRSAHRTFLPRPAMVWDNMRSDGDHRACGRVPYYKHDWGHDDYWRNDGDDEAGGEGAGNAKGEGNTPSPCVAEAKIPGSPHNIPIAAREHREQPKARRSRRAPMNVELDDFATHVPSHPRPLSGPSRWETPTPPLLSLSPRPSSTQKYGYAWLRCSAGAGTAAGCV